MPFGLNGIELTRFFTQPGKLFGKSIQHPFRFLASFLDDPFAESKGRIGPMPVINSYHILNVTIPHYSFERQTQYYGQVPRTFPVLSKFEGIEFSVTFEEDEMGTIAFFINWLQRSIIDKDGYYVAPLNNRVGNFVVEISDTNGIPNVYYIFKKIYFLNAGQVEYDYESNESIKYTITFGCDLVDTWFTKYSGINAIQKGLASGASSVVDKLKDQSLFNKAGNAGSDVGGKSLKALNRALR